MSSIDPDPAEDAPVYSRPGDPAAVAADGDAGEARASSVTAVEPSTSTADTWDASPLLRPRKDAPKKGWRRALFVASGQSVNLGPSVAEQREAELLAHIRVPVPECHRIAVVSLKGGVGKTTTSATLGATLAAARGDRVIAVDANPDLGTLGDRFPKQTSATVRDLLQAAMPASYAEMRAFTSQAPNRLELLASHRDPAVSQAFSEFDYRRVASIIARFYNIMITDSGTGLLHGAMRGILGLAHSLIVVTSASVDGARSADATLDWLNAHGYGELVSHSVAVVSTVRAGSSEVDVDGLTKHFEARCRAVVRIPYDQHLEAGAEIDPDRLKPATREQLLKLAATVADGFSLGVVPRDELS